MFYFSSPGKEIKESSTTTTGVKCVLVGDGAVGKTNLIFAYLENKFVEDHLPTASDIYNCMSIIQNISIKLG